MMSNPRYTRIAYCGFLPARNAQSRGVVYTEHPLGALWAIDFQVMEPTALWLHPRLFIHKFEKPDPAPALLFVAFKDIDVVPRAGVHNLNRDYVTMLALAHDPLKIESLAPRQIFNAIKQPQRHVVGDKNINVGVPRYESMVSIRTQQATRSQYIF